jgi:hypothetical protein
VRSVISLFFTFAFLDLLDGWRRTVGPHLQVLEEPSMLKKTAAALEIALLDRDTVAVLA